MQPDTALQLATTQLTRVRAEIGKIIVGQQDVVDGVLICLLAGGHVLLEGVPGLGKTTLLRTLSKVMHLKYSRIQFTPDLMPADIVGSMIIDSESGTKALRFSPGPIFAHLVLADEINRATPKTQSALLEAMQEHTVTSGTQTMELEPPFLVMATQNPIEMEGTYPLPEAQLDRFLMKILVPLSDASRAGHHRRTHQPERRDRGRAGAHARGDPGFARRLPSGSGRAACSGSRHQSGDGHAAGRRRKRTSWRTSSSATEARRAALRRWWSADACSR